MTSEFFIFTQTSAFKSATSCIEKYPHDFIMNLNICKIQLQTEIFCHASLKFELIKLHIVCKLSPIHSFLLASLVHTSSFWCIITLFWCKKWVSIIFLFFLFFFFIVVFKFTRYSVKWPQKGKFLVWYSCGYYRRT